jgi:hypothetical protein
LGAEENAKFAEKLVEFEAVKESVTVAVGSLN